MTCPPKLTAAIGACRNRIVECPPKDRLELVVRTYGALFPRLKRAFRHDLVASAPGCHRPRLFAAGNGAGFLDFSSHWPGGTQLNGGIKGRIADRQAAVDKTAGSRQRPAQRRGCLGHAQSMSAGGHRLAVKWPVMALYR